MPDLKHEYQQHMDSISPQVDDLPGDLSLIAREIDEVFPGFGVKVAMRLADRLRGSRVLLHNTDGLLRRCRDAWMRQRYDAGGVTVRDLALAVGIGQRQAEKIIGRTAGDWEQMSLF